MARTRDLLVTAVAVLSISGGAALGAYIVAQGIVESASSDGSISVSATVLPHSSFPNSLPVAASRVDSASIVFVGDVMLDRNVATRIRKAGTDTYPFQKISTDPRFTDADLRVMNLEGPVTVRRAAPDKGEVDFMFDPRFIPVLKSVGFGAASQANNDELDQGRAGADDSRRRLLAGGFLVFGDETRDDDAVSVATTTINGRRIAFVGFNDVSAKIDDAAASSTLAWARASADTVIAVVHWGTEYQDHPTRAVQQRAHWLIDHGVDVVIGGHPHWTQGVSSYKGKPILWSLGNFVFDQDFSVETRQGLAVRLLVSDTETSIELNPVQIDLSQPRFLDGTERENRLKELASLSDASLMHQVMQGKVTLPSS